MKLFVNPYSGIPLYIQISEQIKKAVLTGILKEGEQLPSVRQLALELLINPNTVVRAYQELEKEGIVVTKRGTGTFITFTARMSSEAHKENVSIKIRELLAEACLLKISKEELKKIFLRELEKKDNGKEV